MTTVLSNFTTFFFKSQRSFCDTDKRSKRIVCLVFILFYLFSYSNQLCCDCKSSKSGYKWSSRAACVFVFMSPRVDQSAGWYVRQAFVVEDSIGRQKTKQLLLPRSERAGERTSPRHVPKTREKAPFVWRFQVSDQLTSAEAQSDKKMAFIHVVCLLWTGRDIW